MDFNEGADLAQRGMEMHKEELEFFAQLVEQHAKATLKALGARIS